MPKTDVVCCGSATLDMYSTVDPQQKDMEMFIEPGSKIEVSTLALSLGGGAVNSAAGYGRLGYNPCFLGKLGEGANGDYIHKSLVEEGIQVYLSERAQEPSGLSFIIQTPDRDRSLFTYKGANHCLKPEDVKLSGFEETDFYHFTSMEKKSLQAQKKLAKYINENDKTLLYNPARYLLKKDLRIDPILEASFFLVLNYREAQILLENHRHIESEDVKEMLFEIQGLGPEIVVVTDGRDRFHAFDGYHFYSGMPYPTRELDVTGAGDGFSTGLLAGWMKKKDLSYALEIARANANSVVQSPDSWTRLDSLETAEKVEKQHEGYPITRQNIE